MDDYLAGVASGALMFALLFSLGWAIEFGPAGAGPEAAHQPPQFMDHGKLLPCVILVGQIHGYTHGIGVGAKRVAVPKQWYAAAGCDDLLAAMLAAAEGGGQGEGR